MFKGIPPTPIGEGVTFGLNQFMQALRENVEVLIEETPIKSSITITQPKAPGLTSPSYEGAAYAIEDQYVVPTRDDVVKLAEDVYRLAADVNYILQYLDVLVRQLKA
jgi:hypothetical protein